MSVAASGVPGRVRGSLVVRGSLDTSFGRAGLVIVVVLLGVALLGPFFAPYSPSEIVGLPFEPPSWDTPFGTDTLGRDVLSRFLHGGRTLVVAAFVATAIAYVIGIAVGMAAGFRGGPFDLVTLGFADLIFAFPPIVFTLVLLGALGTSVSIVVIAIAVPHIPRIVRIVRSVTLEIATQEFVEAAIARGDPLRAILRRDILPNIWTPVLADFGLRLTGSLILFGTISFLGLGPAPPTPDWGLMISENRGGLITQPWVIIVPAVAIALLAIGINLVADGIARSAGRSIVSRGV